ncbi:MAG: hypothetical protein DMD32_05210 [Gemmatimonadetes bacterium]|nr:MAG: hypothetical protein DMD32_05210 [Gemmatimonadota bacterium]
MGQSPGSNELPAAPRRLVSRRGARAARCRPRSQPAAAARAAALRPGHPDPSPPLVGRGATAERRRPPAGLGAALRRLSPLCQPRAALRAIHQHALSGVRRGVRNRLVRLALAGIRDTLGDARRQTDRQGARRGQATATGRRRRAMS